MLSTQDENHPPLPGPEAPRYKLWATQVDMDLVQMRYEVQTIRQANAQMRADLSRMLEAIERLQKNPAGSD